jgi:glycosyltransferase involved in cell wall biosynthesis
MKLSVIIPYMNDDHALGMVLPHLLKGRDPDECEIIIIDNGSFKPLKLDHPNVRVIRNRRNAGVGGAFNQGVEMAKAAEIVLMGCDTIPQEGWYDRVLETLSKSTSTIYNCVSSGFTDTTPPFSPSRTRRYGAFLLYMVTKQDLPTSSPLQKDPKFSKILQAKWNFKEQDKRKTYVEVGCLLGAFYWMHKEDYLKLNGWNGHQMWGSLEPFLSIKARAHGMKIVVDKKLDSAHYYGRSIQRPGRLDLQFYNMLFMAHTMFSDALREELIEHLRYGGRDEKVEKLNVNQARVMIKRNHGLVQAERDYNNHYFQNGLINNWDKFNEI